MHIAILNHREAIADLCRRYGVRRLELFGSAARADDFDPECSDADFLVEFTPSARYDTVGFLALKDALEAELGRSVDLIDRIAVEASRNHIRRQSILTEAQPLFAA